MFYNVECENGFYGKECLQTCGKCMFGDICDKVTGICMSGCDPGYQDAQCQRGK